MAARLFTLREIAEVLGVSKRAAELRARRAGWPFETKGNRHLYRLSVLPPEVQVALALKYPPEVAPPELPADMPPPRTFDYDREALWAWAESRSEKQRATGRERARILRAVAELNDGGMKLEAAFRQVATQEGKSWTTLRGWWFGTATKVGARLYDRRDWDAALIPGYTGTTKHKPFDPAAWEFCQRYYLTRNGPSAKEAARRTIEAAASHGWQVPSQRTIERRIERDIPEIVKVYRREGEEALRRVLPWQRRDKRALRPGEIVSGDGLKLDKIWVDWGDEIINTTTAWVWQDVYSGRLLAHRIAKTENTDLFRLATYDLVGIVVPDVVQIDNTRVAANKAMTGQAPGRRRFGNRSDDPVGILLQLGITPQFTNPDQTMSNPGVKPVERAFRDLHEAIRQHPRLIDRGYSKDTAVPIEELRAIVAEEVARHNARKGRRTPVCGGVKSFDDVFFEAFKKHPIRQATEAQRRLLLLMPEVVRASRAKGEIQLSAGRGPTGKPRYWSEVMAEHRGKQVVVYYDPENLSEPVHVYDLSGQYIGEAERIGDTGFNDTQAAREWAKYNRRTMKALKKIAEDQTRMSALEVAALAAPPPDDLEIPEPGVVRGNFQQKRRVVDGRPVGSEADAIAEDEFDETLRASIHNLALARQRESLEWDDPEEENSDDL